MIRGCSKINLEKPGENVEVVNIESIITFDLEEIITKYDQQLFQSLREKDYLSCENYLSDFCFELLDMVEEEQVFVARIFLVSVITDIIRVHNRKNLLHPRTLSAAYAIISKVEKWENISEFLLHIPWFIERLKEDIIADQLLFEGSIHVEKALQLIHYNLAENILSVRWLAEQLQITTAHLTNLFKLQLGETVSSYIMKRKMNEITFELTYTNRPLQEIREKYGFMNHSNFIQQFKKYNGMTPLKYQQKKYDY